MEPSNIESQPPSAAAARSTSSEVRGRSAGSRPPGTPTNFVRSLSLSALLHLGVVCGVFLVLLWFSMRADRVVERRDSFLAALEAPPPDEPEPEEEPPPEVEEPEPEEEPELVERPPVIEQTFPPEPPVPDPLDWLPPEDPLAEIDPELWALPPEPEPEPAPILLPPPEELPDPDPVEEAVAEVQKAPVAIEKPQPRYPKRALALGWEGTVRLRIQVDAEGKVIDIEVVESTGHEILDQAAERAFRRWVFAKREPGDPEVRAFIKSFVFVQ